VPYSRVVTDKQDLSETRNGVVYTTRYSTATAAVSPLPRRPRVVCELIRSSTTATS